MAKRRDNKRYDGPPPVPSSNEEDKIRQALLDAGWDPKWVEGFMKNSSHLQDTYRINNPRPHSNTKDTYVGPETAYSLLTPKQRAELTPEALAIAGKTPIVRDSSVLGKNFVAAFDENGKKIYIPQSGTSESALMHELSHAYDESQNHTASNQIGDLNTKQNQELYQYYWPKEKQQTGQLIPNLFSSDTSVRKQAQDFFLGVNKREQFASGAQMGPDSMPPYMANYYKGFFAADIPARQAQLAVGKARTEAERVKQERSNQTRPPTIGGGKRY